MNSYLVGSTGTHTGSSEYTYRACRLVGDAELWATRYFDGGPLPVSIFKNILSYIGFFSRNESFSLLIRDFKPDSSRYCRNGLVNLIVLYIEFYLIPLLSSVTDIPESGFPLV